MHEQTIYSIMHVIGSTCMHYVFTKCEVLSDDVHVHSPSILYMHDCTYVNLYYL